MIDNNKHYTIDGWAVIILVEVFKTLKRSVELQQKNYSAEEFLQTLDHYDFVVQYLVNLDVVEKDKTIYIQDDVQKPLRDLLTRMNISVDDINKRDESQSEK